MQLLKQWKIKTTLLCWISMVSNILCYIQFIFVTSGQMYCLTFEVEIDQIITMCNQKNFVVLTVEPLLALHTQLRALIEHLMSNPSIIGLILLVWYRSLCDDLSKVLCLMVICLSPQIQSRSCGISYKAFAEKFVMTGDISRNNGQVN